MQYEVRDKVFRSFRPAESATEKVIGQLRLQDLSRR